MSEWIGISILMLSIFALGYLCGRVICALCRPSEQSEISRIEQELHGKTPEEQYEFLYWLLLKFGLAYTDSRLAVIEWLRGKEQNDEID